MAHRDLRRRRPCSGLKRWRATPTGRLAFDRFKLRLPIMGEIVQKTAIARFCQTLAALARSGVSIMEALDIVAGTAGQRRGRPQRSPMPASGCVSANRFRSP